jgi:transposase InsO family protein
LVDEAVRAGARQSLACAEAGISERTLQRWREADEDRRRQVSRPPENRLSDAEVGRVLAVVNSPEFRDCSPKQIVPTLADRGEYLASESTIYRLLRARGLMAHRGAARPAQPRPSRQRVAHGPNQVWSWDITYLRAPVRGTYFYLYLVEDVWSRRIVGWAVHERESHDLAAELIRCACRDQGASVGVVLHSDNGAAMKGATMLATLQKLGVVASFSRPGVSDDNPFSEALFRTLKYRPNFPSKAFASLAATREWVEGFVHWYNHEHLHSAIRFTTPDARHTGRDVAQLARRHAVYQQARHRNPKRWAGRTRNWSRIDAVILNPDPDHDARTAMRRTS